MGRNHSPIHSKQYSFCGCPAAAAARKPCRSAAEPPVATTRTPSRAASSVHSEQHASGEFEDEHSKTCTPHAPMSRFMPGICAHAQRAPSQTSDAEQARRVSSLRAHSTYASLGLDAQAPSVVHDALAHHGHRWHAFEPAVRLNQRAGTPNELQVRVHTARTTPQAMRARTGVWVKIANAGKCSAACPTL